MAEGQCLGNPLAYGGPYLGLLACREKFIRKMPGRLVGQTVDRNGKRCWVLTLQTREQHIRREKATSNICTNQGLMALRAAVYLAALGPKGLKETAELCLRKAHYAAEQLGKVDGVATAVRPAVLQGIHGRRSASGRRSARRRRQDGYLAGLPLGPLVPRPGRLLDRGRHREADAGRDRRPRRVAARGAGVEARPWRRAVSRDAFGEREVRLAKGSAKQGVANPEY